jgi:hypothetical protein
LRRADHLFKGVLPSVLIRLRNLWCEALTRTAEPMMMIMVMLYQQHVSISLGHLQAHFRVHSEGAYKMVVKISYVLSLINL